MERRTARRGRKFAPGVSPGRAAASPREQAKKEDVVEGSGSSGDRVAKRRLLCSMDYGTKTLAFACRVATPGDVPDMNSIKDVEFSAQEHWAPQVVAWDANGTFLWGEQVKLALLAKDIQHEDIIELVKLLLYKGDHATSAIAQRVQQQLRGRSIEDVLEAHFRAIMAFAKDKAKGYWALGSSETEILNMPMHLFLSVPQMWKAPANRIMTQAAKAAGIQFVDLVYEPQAAAAYYTHNAQEHLNKRFEPGDEILVADVGGGTGDFVSYQVTTTSEEGASVGLQIAHEAEGALCGSEFVNENFRNWIEDTMQDIDAVCARLRLTRFAFLRIASDDLERIKKNFYGPILSEMQHVMIQGANNAMESLHTIPLKGEQLEAFYKPVVQEIVDRIRSQTTDRTKVLIIPGGFGRSQYLLDVLHSEFGGILDIKAEAISAVGSFHPVSRGALLRYHDIQTRGLEAAQKFGIGQVETFDRNVHKDVLFQPGDRMPNERVCRNGTFIKPGFVYKDPHDDEVKIVYERWLPLVDGVQAQTPGQKYRAVAWQQQYVYPDDQQLTVQVYWTERADVEEHSPIAVAGNVKASGVRDGIEPWGDTIVKRLPDLGGLGWKTQRDRNGDDVYEVYWRLKLKCVGANVRVYWHIAKPGTQPFDAQGNAVKRRVEFLEAEDGTDGIFNLCEEAYNPFPRTSLA